jgi:hypothetical protein
MSTNDLNPYEILGVTPTSKPKDIILAQAKALKDGKHDKAVIVQAMQDLTNESKRAEVDVLRVGEARFDFAAELSVGDPQSLLKMLADDAPILALTMLVPWPMLVPWQHLISLRPQLEDCPLEPVLLDATTPVQDHDEPNLPFPI